MYTLTFAPQALEDLAKLKKSEPAAFKKAGKLLGELQDHPKTGNVRFVRKMKVVKKRQGRKSSRLVSF